MATTKATGTAKNSRDSRPKYLGVKLSAGQTAKAGQILIRQRGTPFVSGKNVRRGGDDTLYALQPGIVRFTTKKRRGFNNSMKFVKVVDVVPLS